MNPYERKAWEECVARIRRHKEKCDYYEPEMDAILAAEAELTRLREALACTSENCSEFGRYHDGDCSECPQGTIRARAGLASKEGTSAP